jgi:hypothetical protein
VDRPVEQESKAELNRQASMRRLSIRKASPAKDVTKYPRMVTSRPQAKAPSKDTSNIIELITTFGKLNFIPKIQFIP